jgi:L-seryl-tRNA(Ser) seleniumtransferase
MKELLRHIPKVDEILKHEMWGQALAPYPAHVAKDALRMTLQELRTGIREGDVSALPSLEAIIASAQKKAREMASPRLRRVVNATGVIIHTNLGRSLLAEAAIRAMSGAASFYSNLEYDAKKGKRGDRHEHCTAVLKELTGAEEALVVNNNAAAVLLVLNTFAEGKEVVISRGELIEIGGSFRIPEVMKKSGALLREVGTTNRTFIKDFEEALSEKTGLLMKAHTSNYRIRGFVHEASTEELIQLGRGHEIPVYYDAGSGLLFPLKNGRNFDEPCISEEMERGIDIISFSGDKLLGGPQAGIILGKGIYIERMKQNSLTRALRPDKFTLSALESTLLLYFDRDRVEKEIPTLRMIHQNGHTVRKRAGRIARQIMRWDSHADISLVPMQSEVGGGSLPDVTLPSFGLALKPKTMSAGAFEERLRMLDVPIIARIEKDRLLFDMRTVQEGDEVFLVSGIETVLSHGT